MTLKNFESFDLVSQSKIIDYWLYRRFQEIPEHFEKENFMTKRNKEENCGDPSERRW